MPEPQVTPDEATCKGGWFSWVAWAIWQRSLLEMPRQVGFVEAGVHGWTGYRTSYCEQRALVSARKPKRRLINQKNHLITYLCVGVTLLRVERRNHF